MPGVLQIEAMAQCGGLLVLSQLEEPEKWSTYFLKIDDVKFRRKVVPGDTLLFRVELLGPVRHGIRLYERLHVCGRQRGIRSHLYRTDH